jgi:hypothetical protein
MNKINKLLIVAVFLAIVSVGAVSAIQWVPLPNVVVSTVTEYPSDSTPINISVYVKDAILNTTGSTPNATVTLTAANGTTYNKNATLVGGRQAYVVFNPNVVPVGTYKVSATVEESDNGAHAVYGPYTGDDLIVTAGDFSISYSPSPIHVGDTVTVKATLKDSSNPWGFNAVEFYLVKPNGQYTTSNSVLVTDGSNKVAYLVFKAEVSGNYDVVAKGRFSGPYSTSSIGQVDSPISNAPISNADSTVSFNVE